MSISTFVPLYADKKALFDMLSDEMLVKVVRALLAYNDTGERPEVDPQDAFTMEVFFNQFEWHVARLAEMQERGKKGGRPKSKVDCVEESIGYEGKPMLSEKNQGCEQETIGFEKKPKRKEKKEKEKENNLNISNEIFPPSEKKSLDGGGETGEDGLPDTPEDFTAPPEESATFLDLPLTGGNKRTVTKAEVWHWSELYQAVDVEEEVRKMAGWLEANPKNRKTKQGINRFINGWLSRAQDQAKKQPHTQGNQPKRVEAQTYSQRQYAPDAFDGPSPAQLAVLSRMDTG